MHNDYEISYEELYGVSLVEYLKEQKLTIDQLINKVETDIRLLKKRLNHIVWELDGVGKSEYSNLITIISRTIDRKEAKIKRLKEWQKELKDNSSLNINDNVNNLFYTRCQEVI